MQFALGDEHGIFITTPKDFPDPAPEAKTEKSGKLVVYVGWLVGWLVGWVCGWRRHCQILWWRFPIRYLLASE